MSLSNFPRPPKDSGRGVHGPPGPHPNGLLTNWGFWKEQLIALGIKWLKLLDTGDGTCLPLADKLVEIGIMPVIRFYRQEPNPGHIYADREAKTAAEYVKRGVFYYECSNEPDLPLEWKDGKRPDNWLDIVVDNFIIDADYIRNAGGYCLFPAFGPGGRGNPFQLIVDRGRKDLLDGNMCLAIHNYCLARPLDYPNDKVTMYGDLITKEEWENTAKDKKKNGAPEAWEMGWETVNEWRKKLANPNANILEDSTCFRAFEYFDYLINQACGHSIPILTTEGGYNIWQRAGTTFGDDPRWPKPSPALVGDLTLKMFQYIETKAPDYYFACMPWLLACYKVGYWQQGFEMQGPFYSDIFKYDWYNCDDGEMPIVKLLKSNPGKERTNMIRRPGIWANNGNDATSDLMLSWKPGAITAFVDYIDNGLFKYKEQNPGVDIILRFQHDPNWQNDPQAAIKLGRQVASKRNDIKILDPYVYFCNEMNLHYENGDQNPANQHLYETASFYQKLADFTRMTATVIKDIVPDMKLVLFGFASGHREDGAPDDNGNPTEAVVGYDYFEETITKYFNNIICHHDYWGHSGGCVEDWLYGNDKVWYAYRWQKVAKLFKTRYGKDIKIIIDECGNMQANHPNFTKQVLDYSQVCLADPRVIALTFFLWNDPTKSPGNILNSWVQRIPNLDAHLDALKSFNLGGIATPPDVIVPKPPVIDPPPKPPVEIPNTNMTIEYKEVKKGEPLLIVGNYPKAGVEFKFYDPFGNFYFLKTGGKQAEYGAPGGTEFGFANYSGNYKLEGDGQTYIIPSDGTKFITLKFDQSTTEKLVKWSSVVMAKTTSDSIWNKLTLDEKKLFSIGEVK